jgi:hypothetical protein
MSPPGKSSSLFLLIYSIHANLPRSGKLSRNFNQLNILDDLLVIGKISPLLGTFHRILNANLHRYSLYSAIINCPACFYTIRNPNYRFLFLTTDLMPVPNPGLYPKKTPKKWEKTL